MDRINEFCKAANLNQDVAPWKGRRRNGKPYGMFTIAKEVGAWTDRYVGVEFLAEIHFTRNDQKKWKIQVVVPVRIEGKYAVRGREISAEAVAMI